jgi:hypothetical protein
MNALELIAEYYGDRRAKRSGVPYMNHITEGLVIMNRLGAGKSAKDAYCVHPIFQDDETLFANAMRYMHEVSPAVLVLAMEYRNVANRGLHCYQVDDPSKIYIGPLEDVSRMLIADKVQNRKDFERYHLGTHPKSNELDRYFRNWLRALDISEDRYLELKEGL